jgi:glycosyltransferase involved in cell wall biosynthesis
VEDEVALTRALQELVDSAALRQSLGTAGARRVREHFHLDAMLAGYAAALWRLSGRNADAAPAATWRAS